MGGRIAVIGSNMMDLVTYINRMPRPGETLEAPRFVIGFGGKGANQAVACARLGSEVMFVGKVGSDLFGQDQLRNFTANGVDARHVGVIDGVSSGVAPIFVDPTGENSILIIKGANDRLMPEDVDRAGEDLAECDLILLQLEVPLPTVYRAVELGAALGKEVLLNPAPATRALELARLADLAFLVPNQTELELLTGMPTATVAEAEAAARQLLAAGIGRVIVTLGGEGALLVGPEERAHVPVIAVTPKDTTGAGDAFIGSFAHHYVRGRDTVAAMRQAARYAADSITRPGTQSSFATAAEFARFCAALDAATPA